MRRSTAPTSSTARSGPAAWPGRILDETAALAQGVIGQETTGPGGITFALRTVPVVT